MSFLGWFQNKESGLAVRTKINRAIDRYVDARSYADPTGVEDASAAFTTMRGLGRPILVIGTYKLSSPSTASGLHLVGRGGTITGYNGTGFVVTGGDVTLEGDLTFSGFQDAADPENQSTNYTTAAIRIATGSTISSVSVARGVKFLNCRSGIRASATSDDVSIDKTISVSNVHIDGAYTDGVIAPFSFRCLYNDVRCVNSTFLNGVGAGRVVAAFQAFSDGFSGSDLPLYEGVGTVRATGNYIDNFVQRTTTGDQTIGNTYEVKGIMASGYDVFVFGNTIKNVTGVNQKCEGIYLKSVRYKVNDNNLYNSGSIEGAIVVKGETKEDYDDNLGGPPTYHGQICGNTVVFDSYSHNHTAIHGSGDTVALTRTAILVDVAEGVSISDNLSVGCNGVDISIRAGANSKEECVSVTRNKSINSTALASINVNGGFAGLTIKENVASTSAATTETSTALVRIEDTSGRGVRRDNLEVSGNKYIVDRASYTGNVRLVQYTADLYECNNFVCRDNVLDAKVGSAATVAGIVFSATASSALVDRFVFSGWGFARKVTNASKFYPVQWSGAHLNKIRSYDIEADWEFETTDDTNHAVFNVPCSNGNSASASLDLLAHRKDSLGNVRHQKLSALFYDNSGSVAQAGTTATIADISGGTASGVSGQLTHSAGNIQVKVNGNTAENWRFKIKARISSVHGDAT